jgi:hypothetical protein
MPVEGQEFAKNLKRKRPPRFIQQDSLLLLFSVYQLARSVMIVVPILFGLPTMFFSIPPLVVLFPATLAFGIQIATAVLGFAAVFAVIVDRFIQSSLSLFDGMLAM